MLIFRIVAFVVSVLALAPTTYLDVRETISGVVDGRGGNHWQEGNSLLDWFARSKYPSARAVIWFNIITGLLTLCLVALTPYLCVVPLMYSAKHWQGYRDWEKLGF